MIHACGMVDLVDDIAFSAEVGHVGPAGVEVRCADPGRLDDGRQRRHPEPGCRPTTRSSARFAIPTSPTWPPPARHHPVRGRRRPLATPARRRGRGHRQRTDRAVPAARAARRRGAEPPAAIVGIPVGFVGAAESKRALADDVTIDVPFLTVHGRRGGSAITAAAINALASEHGMTGLGSVGRCIGVGVARAIPSCSPSRPTASSPRAPRVAYFAAVGRDSNARRVVGGAPDRPSGSCASSTPSPPSRCRTGVSYETLLIDFYDESAKRIAEAARRRPRRGRAV